MTITRFTFEDNRLADHAGGNTAPCQAVGPAWPLEHFHRLLVAAQLNCFEQPATLLGWRTSICRKSDVPLAWQSRNRHHTLNRVQDIESVSGHTGVASNPLALGIGIDCRGKDPASWRPNCQAA